MSPHSPRVIAMAGDWHGNLWWALRMLPIIKAAGADVIVQLGDFGYWRDDPATRKYLRRLNRELSALEVPLLWIDGNHEDHSRLQSLPLDDDGTRPITDHITHLPRGHRWTWPDLDGSPRTWLALGGAVSVDRDDRTPGRSWWREEVISDQDVAIATGGGPVDVLVSHDALTGAAIPMPTGESWPQAVLDDADAHRELLRDVVDVVRPNQIWHGHYHVRYDADLDLGWSADRPESSGICQVHGLDRDDTHWAANLALVDPTGKPLPWPALA